MTLDMPFDEDYKTSCWTCEDSPLFCWVQQTPALSSLASQHYGEFANQIGHAVSTAGRRTTAASWHEGTMIGLALVGSLQLGSARHMGFQDENLPTLSGRFRQPSKSLAIVGLSKV
jgi:hypothetical protein